MTRVDEPLTGRQPSSGRGSSASTKQIAWSVYKGQKVRCIPVTGVAILGYVFGQDDYHWLVVRPDLSVSLVHKSCPVVDIEPKETFAEERNHPALEEMVGPFRRYICDNILFRPEPMAASIKKVG